uniref:Uncharacterized protein n=1 Tax=Oryza brachyantha TaxID=4533 RepID=J3KZL0_ORYBR
MAAKEISSDNILLITLDRLTEEKKVLVQQHLYNYQKLCLESFNMTRGGPSRKLNCQGHPWKQDNQPIPLFLSDSVINRVSIGDLPKSGINSMPLDIEFTRQFGKVCGRHASVFKSEIVVRVLQQTPFKVKKWKLIETTFPRTLSSIWNFLKGIKGKQPKTKTILPLHSFTKAL